MTPREIFGKLFVKGRFFTIAIRKRQTKSIIDAPTFCAEYVVPADRQKWVADPMIIDEGEKTYLFYEAVIRDKGHIEVAEIGEDCTIRNSCVVLKDKYHYSYPFVFKHDDVWYMIPESSEASEVRLYRSVRFPDKWTLCDILLRGKLVDSTVIQDKGQLFFLTYELSGVSERVTPHAYIMEIKNGKVMLEKLEWKHYDELRVRGAGPAIRWKKELYRPAQISQEYRYGDAVMFFKPNIGEAYVEEPIGIIQSRNLKIPGYSVDGLHTYTRSRRYEAIDVRCCEVDYFKPIRKISKMIKR